MISRHHPGRCAAAALLAVALPAAGCAGPAGGTDSRDRAEASGGGDGTVTVLAAASLTEPLTVLARAYERDHPGARVALSFGSSTTLARQVAEGAPADVAAVAGPAALASLPPDVTGGGGGRAVIARNTLAIATPPENPGRITALRDLGRRDLDVVLCASSAPCGAAADRVLRAAGVTPHVVSREVDVKATLAKVRLGEADAAVVYRSDVVTAAGQVAAVEIPAAENTTVDYPMLWLNDDPDTVGFARLVTGPAGVAALTAAGFLAP